MSSHKKQTTIQEYAIKRSPPPPSMASKIDNKRPKIVSPVPPGASLHQDDAQRLAEIHANKENQQANRRTVVNKAKAKYNAKPGQAKLAMQKDALLVKQDPNRKAAAHARDGRRKIKDKIKTMTLRLEAYNDFETEEKQSSLTPEMLEQLVQKAVDAIQEAAASNDGKKPFLYVAKCQTGSHLRESRAVFGGRGKGALIVLADGTPMTYGTIPDALQGFGSNVTRINIFESVSESDAFVVEMAIHERLGLLHGHLWQGFGFGGLGKPGKTVHSVDIFLYHKLESLLIEGRVQFNDNALLFHHSEGPGPLSSLKDLDDCLRTINRPRAQSRALGLLHSLEKNGACDVEVLVLEDEDDDGDDCSDRKLSAIEVELESRKTAAGGYSQKESSKNAIGKANSNRSSWNSGVARNAKDKAAISAGVLNSIDGPLLESIARYNKNHNANETLASVKALSLKIKSVGNSYKKVKDKALKAKRENELEALKALRDLIRNS